MFPINIMLSLAMLAIIFAGAAWYFLVRPVPEQRSAATITGRTFQPAGEVEKTIPRTTRSLEDVPREIRYKLPDRYLFNLRLDDGTQIGYTAPALGLEKAQVGQRVQIVYLERYIPFFGRRIYIKEMTLLPSY